MFDKKMPDLKWSMMGIWNESIVVSRSDRKPEPRDYIYASEMGGAFIDRFLKMKGITPTNPPNMRSLRKFSAGHIWEWIIELILRRAGILIASEEHVDYQYKGLLRVAGRLDHLAGGKPDWDKAKSEMEDLHLPEVISGVVEDMINHFMNRYPNGLEIIILEAKSVSSFMFENYLKSGTANPNHKLQLFHYLKSKNLPEGHMVYICKDDCRMIELGIFNPSSVEDDYKEDIKKMTDYFTKDIQPELEPLIIFDEMTMKFNYNWKVAYSGYLTMLYGFAEQMEYQDIYSPLASKWTRVFKRVVNGDKMTALNLEVIEETKKVFPDYDKYVDLAKLKTKQGLIVEGEDEEI